jgi:TPR repeat protein
MINLSDMYAKGEGVPMDLKMALQWAQRAAQVGDQRGDIRARHIQQLMTEMKDVIAKAAGATGDRDDAANGDDVKMPAGSSAHRQ